MSIIGIMANKRQFEQIKKQIKEKIQEEKIYNDIRIIKAEITATKNTTPVKTRWKQ